MNNNNPSTSNTNLPIHDTTISHASTTQQYVGIDAYKQVEGALSQAGSLGLHVSTDARFKNYGTDIPPVGVKRFKRKTKRSVDFAEKALLTYSNDEIIHKLMYDFNFLAKFVTPEISHYDFPDTIQSIWQMTVRGLMDMEEFISEVKYVLGIPRGFAKTTIMKLLCVYNIIFSSNNFMLIIGSSDRNAENIIRDVASMIRSSQLEQLFGKIDKFDTDSANDKRFTFLGKPIVMIGKGQGTSLRGINIGNLRPNFILCDDMQTEENAKSPVESDNLLTWFSSTLVDAVSNDGAIYIYIGNTYAYEGSLIAKLIKDPEWTSNTIGAITSEGDSLWEELKPLTKILSGYLQAKRLGKEANWLAQMMNAVDINMNNNVDLDLVAEKSYEYWDKIKGENRNPDPVVKAIIVDPASSRENADDVAIAVVEEHEKNIPVIVELSSRKRTPLSTIQEVIRLAIYHKCYVVLIEGIAYQQTLQFWMEHFMKEWDINWVEVEIFNAHRTSKTVRILNSFEYLERGEIVLSPEALETYKVQAKPFNHLKTNNLDDALDVVSEAKLQLQDKHMLIMNAQEKGYLSHQSIMRNQNIRNSNYDISAI